MKNIVVLISGSGSNLQAIMNACESGIIANAKVAAVFSNKADAYGLTRAKEAGITTEHLAACDFTDREAFDRALAEQIDQYQPDLVILAGYMRILSGEFVRHFAGKMINIHPSLLPKYTGLHTHQRAIDAGDREHGTSVHFVTEELDGGPVILQAKVPIFSDDNADDVMARVQEQEHRIYPLVAHWCLQQRVVMEGNNAYFDGACLPPSGYASDDEDAE
ncbi:phosphoribosylglycinamide formyltransferase [Photobacterium aphoticum]|uniref:Phosphoribosylglycinamide formyltransferase n=1 Tax=Photobacterium aphoticum TaxID=754436 RepID=A0A0J1GI32_9GAMM|nr:phosphoribosylglycinamide formyltransferase [Photobacterium aphoticum]KLU99215.1 phosphoribosylglycinamide formyltransferase [Photobacterium aphoticum]PSU56224.1 phosphoribosylglycinamide formyltransferase [Photobacterium aphoticum]GHA63160.1 phosphoribosylglycinamide formyltransferase [Photobacterium aphoticum]